VYVLVSITGYELPSNVLTPLISFVSAVFLFRASFLAGRRWLGWAAAGFGCVVWGLADALWAFDLYFLHRDPDADVPLSFLYVLTNVGFLIAVLYLALYDRRRWSKFQFLVDMGALAIMLTAFMYFVILGSFFEHGAMWANLLNISSLVSLVIDMLIVSFAVSTLLSMDRKKLLCFLKLSLAGVGIFIVGDVLYAFGVLNESYVPNGLIDVLYMLGIVLLGCSAVSFGDSPSNTFNLRTQVDSTLEIITRALILLAIPVIAWLLHRLDAFQIVLFAGVLLGHQVISLILRRLLQRELELEEKSREAEYLEARIDERTRELRVMNQTLENLIKRDAITGQFNRKYFLEQIEEWIGQDETDRKVWLMILDFDRFKSINDTYGHDVGDQTLRLIGKRLESIAGEATVIARLGGDEFGVVCHGQSAETISSLLGTITGLCKAPLEVGAYTLHLGVSVGVACWPDDAKTRSDLMRHADVAMYLSKGGHSGGTVFFNSSLSAAVERSNQIDLAIRKTNISGEFTVFYQPQYTVSGDRLVGAEALVRWTSSVLGRITPDEFIPVAEENGIIIPLSDWVMAKALRQAADWNRRYGLELLMGINISPRQLDASDFLRKLELQIAEYGVKPEWVNLEMTERCAMKGEAFMLEIFDRLANLRIASSIDDFGTGYSSLSYLKKFDIDYLKIAKELVDGIEKNESDRQIVRAIIMMSEGLGLRTIAEGVEDEAQTRILESLGCDEIQGYYYGKPVPPEEFEKLYLNKTSS
jgi:diguanylate cyclase (GGDEF)-like protein